METFTYAYCFADGVILFGDCEPEGSLAFAVYRGSNAALFIDEVQTMARHGHADDLYLVPGVPEAETDQHAVDALIMWREWAFARNGRKSDNGIVQFTDVDFDEVA